MTSPDKPAETPPVPPIRRPVLFYATAVVAFGLLGGSVLALLL